MKRLVFISVVILIVGIVSLWGDRIAGRALDAELGPLLTRELGLPVSLAPINVNLLQLKARSSRLVMGDPSNPAVVAADVEVRLALSDLLEREIRLVYASATDLMVNPSRWPSSEGPLPNDYLFLDQWLPKNLELESGQYISENGESYPVQNLHWQRQPTGGASVDWAENRGGKDIALSAALTSLEDLLKLLPIELTMSATAAEEPESTVAVTATVEPGKSSAYTLKANIQASGIDAKVVAGDKSAWHLPGQSETTISTLEPAKVLTLISLYTESDDSQETEAWLASRLPKLALPVHQGHLAIDEIRFGDELGVNTKIDFAADEHGLQIQSFTSDGPTSTVTGKIGIVSGEKDWAVSMDAIMEARQEDSGIAAQFLNARWLWSTGKTQLIGKGNTWGELLNTLEGEIALEGLYRGTTNTPVNIEARLDNQPGALALDHMVIALGDGHFSGSAALSETTPRKLTLDITGERLNLDFLFEQEDVTPEPGIGMPEFLTDILPDMELDWTFSVTDVDGPSLQLAKAQATLHRTEDYLRLNAEISGVQAGTIDLTLEAIEPPGKPTDVHLNIDFTELDIPEFFEQDMLLHSRGTGNITLTSQGDEIEELFAAMRGTTAMAVELRADNNWKRRGAAEETLKFSGNSRLVIEKNRIIGIKIEKLDIDSTQQDLTGEISMFSDRAPWLLADLKSKQINLSGLQALQPMSTEEADQADLLQTLRNLGAAQVSLDVDSLILGDTPLSQLYLEVEAGPEVFRMKKLDFITHGSKFESEGKITWSKQRAKFEGLANLSNVDLDQFLTRNPDIEHIPVSGTAKLASEGSKIAELLGNVSGYIDLQATKTPKQGDTKARRKLSMTAKRLPNGVQADISTLQLGESELAGSIRYLKTFPPSLDIEIRSGTLSLVPWETAETDAVAAEPEKNDDTGIEKAAKTSSNFLANALRSPVRFFTGNDKSKPQDKLFSKDPLALDSLQGFNVDVKGHMDALVSTVITAKDVTFSGNLESGRLALEAKSGQMGGGRGEVALTLNSTAKPPTLNLTSQFENLRGLSDKKTFTRSGFISVQSRGYSQAELAAASSGLIYLKLGPGPFDYVNAGFLTADIASSMFHALIPGIEREDPTLECGLTVAIFKDGIGKTPFGFAARTNRANLLGGVEVDLAKENMQLKFSSRSREGVGLSVSNVFSNTIQVRGPLTDPHIVPNTTGLAWRGWAAFMTAGLSVVGESIFKRAMAAENPCKSIEEIIHEELCPKNKLAASSAMICPKSN